MARMADCAPCIDCARDMRRANAATMAIIEHRLRAGEARRHNCEWSCHCMRCLGAAESCKQCAPACVDRNRARYCACVCASCLHMMLARVALTERHGSCTRAAGMAACCRLMLLPKLTCAADMAACGRLMLKPKLTCAAGMAACGRLPLLSELTSTVCGTHPARPKSGLSHAARNGRRSGTWPRPQINFRISAKMRKTAVSFILLSCWGFIIQP